MRRTAVAGTLALSLIASVALLAGRASGAHSGALSRGQFLSACRYSHTLPDDPIVFPGVEGASHSHDFFANRSTDADSTYASLRAAGTTCRRERDTAAYWVPSLYLDGRQVAPARVNAYYVTRGKYGPAIRPFPAGLKVIAGDAKATGPQPRTVASWSCGPEGGVPPSSEAPTCPAGSALRLHLRFPDCWNGADRDSADHKGHMAYSTRGHCPARHRVPVPGLNLNVVYPTSGGPGVTLASGSPHTAHGDFFNAWDQRELARLVRACLNAAVHCGSGG